MKQLITALLLSTLLISPTMASDALRIVGSSTVYPFTTAVAEQFGNQGFPTPVVESTGTGGGIKIFCEAGMSAPELVNASRPIKESELALCGQNGVKSVTQLSIGFDGIVLANSKESIEFELTKAQIFQAISSDEFMNWSDIDPTLPNVKIEVLGPPPTSGTRDSFIELVMVEGAKELGLQDTMDADAFKVLTSTFREDGGYIDAGENDNLIVQKLIANPTAVGIFGYSFLEENMSQIQGAVIEGVDPTYETISDGSYTISRELFVYYKTNADNDTLAPFIAEYSSEKAVGEDGYLSIKGLIPNPDGAVKTIIDIQ